MKLASAWICGLVWLMCSSAAQAHKPSDSYLTVTQSLHGAVLDVQWDIALRDLEQAIGLDGDADGRITWGELKSRQGAVIQYAGSRLELQAVAGKIQALCPLHFKQLLFDEHVDGGYAVLRFDGACPFRATRLALHYSLLFDVDPNHRGLLDVRAAGLSEARVLPKESPSTVLDLGSPRRAQQFVAFVQEGIWHIWQGADHILFLCTLLLPAVVRYRNKRWEPQNSVRAAFFDVLKVVTAFTVAHSLTLSLAVNGWIQLPSRWVESAIALTVLLGALNNLFPLVHERRWLVAFAFGLIHGLGFASVLTDLGLSGLNLALALVGFNVGVETGQLALVLVLVPIAYRLRNTDFYRRVFMPGGAVVIGCIAIYWFVNRAWGISFQ